MNTIRKSIKQYLQERRALGFKLYSTGLLLHQFADYLEEHKAKVITKKLALQWACISSESHLSYRAKRLGIVRQFAKYHSAVDPHTEVPPQGLIPYQCQRSIPYIYTDKEIIKLIKASKKLNSETGFRALTYSTFFGLISITGMRIGEIIGLDSDDVDLKEGIIVVKKAKLDRTRLMPIDYSVTKVLLDYLKHRDRIYTKPKTASFFVSEAGVRLTACTVRWTFNKLSCQTGLRQPTDRVGPRIHDFRHSFAVKTLQDWYRQGKNVEKLLPQLSMYLGHRHLNDTYWYMTATPELLKLAADRAAERII